MRVSINQQYFYICLILFFYRQKYDTTLKLVEGEAAFLQSPDINLLVAIIPLVGHILR